MSAPPVSRFRVPDLGVGVGYRLPHAEAVLNERPAIDFYEIISENYMADGGPPRARLERLKALAPLVPHGVSLSLGSAPNADHSRRLRALLDRVDPPWWSDHLCFTGTPRVNAHDLLPLPYTEATLKHVVDRIRRAQDETGRLFAVENVSSYLSYRVSERPEWEYLAELVERADCAILLDVNNIVVSAHNHGFDPTTYLDAVPLDRVVQIHLAGHTIRPEGYRLDTHDREVDDEVWALYEETIRRSGSVSTLIEWDEHIPPLARLVHEVERARARRDAGLRARPLPDDWQERMVEMIRGAAPLDGAWFGGGAHQTPLDQINVYREQFQLRLGEALEAELPGLRALMGEALDPVLEAWLLERPPRSWSLDHATHGLSAWLEARGAPQVQVEMAALDAAVSRVFLAADAAPATPTELASDPRLKLVPSAERLRLTWDVHRFRSAALQGEEAPAPTPGGWRLLVYRGDEGPRHWELDPATDAALAAFAGGATVGEAVDAALRADPDAGSRLSELFREISRRSVLTLA